MVFRTETEDPLWSGVFFGADECTANPARCVRHSGFRYMFLYIPTAVLEGWMTVALLELSVPITVTLGARKPTTVLSVI